jgi:hypothetical protein
MFKHRLQSFFAIARARYDGDVAFDLKQSRKCSQDHSLIFRDYNANRLASVFVRGIQ